MHTLLCKYTILYLLLLYLYIVYNKTKNLSGFQDFCSTADVLHGIVTDYQIVALHLRTYVLRYT